MAINDQTAYLGHLTLAVGCCMMPGAFGVICDPFLQTTGYHSWSLVGNY